MRHMKSTYIIVVVLILLMFLNNFIYLKVDLYSILGLTRTDVDTIQEAGTEAEAYEDSFMSGFNAGMEATTTEEADVNILGEGIYYYDDVATLFVADISGLVIPMLLAIFTGLYIGSIYRTGLDKNLMAYNRKRGVLLAARFAVIVIYTLVLQILTWLFAALSMALMGESVRWGIDKAFVIYSVVVFLLTVAFTQMVCLFTTLTRSKAAGITLGIILSTGVLSTVMSVVTLMLQTKFGLDEDFSLGNYTITMNIAGLNLNSDGHFVLRAIIVAVVYFAVSYAINLLIVKKRDVN